MKFIVSRTSMYGDDKPCDEASKMTYTRIDMRGADDPSKIPAYKENSSLWYDEGTNHRIVKGKIMRDFEETGWFIEINSLEELLEFQKKYGDLVLQHSMWNEEIPEIEIYDYYRE